MVAEPSITHGIACIARVLAAVDLDHQAPLTANEIDDERSNGLLADELAAIDCTGAQPVPELELGLSAVPAQAAGALGLLVIGAAHGARCLRSPPLPPYPRVRARGNAR